MERQQGDKRTKFIHRIVWINNFLKSFKSNIISSNHVFEEYKNGMT